MRGAALRGGGAGGQAVGSGLSLAGPRSSPSGGQAPRCPWRCQPPRAVVRTTGTEDGRAQMAPVTTGPCRWAATVTLWHCPLKGLGASGHRAGCCWNCASPAPRDTGDQAAGPHQPWEAWQPPSLPGPWPLPQVWGTAPGWSAGQRVPPLPDPPTPTAVRPCAPAVPSPCARSWGFGSPRPSDGASQAEMAFCPGSCSRLGCSASSCPSFSALGMPRPLRSGTEWGAAPGSEGGSPPGQALH